MTKQQYWVLVALSIVTFVGGMVSQYYDPGADFPASEIPFTILSIILINAWYYLDTERIKYPRSRMLNVGVIACSLLALPYYFFRSRGRKNGVLYTCAFIGVLIALSWIEIAGINAISYGLQGK